MEYRKNTIILDCNRIYSAMIIETNISCFAVNRISRGRSNANNCQLTIRRKNILLVTSDMIMLVDQANASLTT